MNTVKKGDILEKKSIGIIHKMIDDRLLPLDRKFIQIHTKKKYPCKDRDSKVEFDLSIEVWPPNANRYSMIYLIECKNYKKRVPQSQIKKFYDDIMETQGVNAKAIFISNSPLQKGAYQIAESRNMMVIEGESKDDFNITMYRKNNPTENQIPIIKETIDKRLVDSGVKIYEKLIDEQILKSVVLSKSNIDYGIDLLSKTDISEIAKTELNKISDLHLSEGKALDKEALVRYMSNEYDIEVISFNPGAKNYLGTCNIDDKKIGINKSIVGTPRELFVLCHEFGHFILHQKLRIKQELLDSFSDTENNLISRKSSLENPNHWVEWQANYFSISLLLPQTSLMACMYKCQSMRKLRMGKLYLDDQSQNRRIFFAIISSMSHYFNLSKTSIIYRLEEYNLINNNTNIKLVSELIEDYKTNVFV